MSVVIAGLARTPVGKFGGVLAPVTGSKLGSIAIRASLQRAGLKDGAESVVDEVILGNVVSAGQGQAPARQAAKGAGLPDRTNVTAVNKVCASGMKSLVYASHTILLKQAKVVVAGGFESMSNIPYYAPKARFGGRMGNMELLDGMIHDGLWDVYNQQHMGMCGEKCAADHSISKEAQDAYATESYERAIKAREAGVFQSELTPVEVSIGRGKTKEVSTDEEIEGLAAGAMGSKIAGMKPAFKRDGGTITGGNASKINDGACTMVVLDKEIAKSLNIAPQLELLASADFEQAPEDFTTAPAGAIKLALERAGLTTKDVHAWEMNEAFAVVALANMDILSLTAENVNVHGGACAIGHPLGASGARIIQSLHSVLTSMGKDIGVAAICNGGGGATAVVVKRVG